MRFLHTRLLQHRLIRVFGVIGSLTVGLVHSLVGHPISLSTAVADIYPDHLQVELRILVEDLVLYHQLKADGEQTVSREDLMTASELHRSFLKQYFRVFLKDGEPLPGEITEVDLSEIPETGVRLDQVMEVGVYYYFHLPMEQQPDYLTFTQQFGGSDAPVPSVMDLILLQKGARLDFPVQIGPRSPHSIALDWENPPRNDRTYWKERREWMKQRREALLGVTSYSATYAYLYLEPREIRFEILVPLLTLETWLPLQREEADYLSVAEQDAMEKALPGFLQEVCHTHIDGMEITAQLDRLDFFTLDIRDFAKKQERKKVGVANARVGMILSFPTKGNFQSASLEWSFFNEVTPLLNTMTYVFDQPGERFFFTDNERTWQWQSPKHASGPQVSSWLSLPPVPSMPTMPLSLLFLLAAFSGGAFALKRNWKIAVPLLVLGGWFGWWNPVWQQMVIPHPTKEAPLPTPPEQNKIAEVLLRNIYRSFDYLQDADVYSALSRSADGDYLEKLYLQIKKGLILTEQGGAHSRVRNVQWLESEPTSHPMRAQSFSLSVKWEITGTVEHWGHIHTRRNAYRAELEVKAVDDEWKLVDLEVLDEDQVESSTQLRGSA
ncbi:MAG: hypothetical protein VYE74_01955 [Verrucomicrobiota bacterium]|nr:hypothetical protein [Verrucomicrobiota bacterium]|tara:strand:- start:346 stop:2169 length:1824 start_codon:yes stop_codon:yes gene_type:complete